MFAVGRQTCALANHSFDNLDCSMEFCTQNTTLALICHRSCKVFLVEKKKINKSKDLKVIEYDDRATKIQLRGKPANTIQSWTSSPRLHVDCQCRQQRTKVFSSGFVHLLGVKFGGVFKGFQEPFNGSSIE